jgi:hypothetical protein
VICSSGIGFDPVLDGHHLLFGFHGIYQGTAVLYDRKTGSLWLHLTGESFEGPLAGRVLEPLATGRHTRWAEWRSTHPHTDVMQPDPRHAARYFERDDARGGNPFFPDVFTPTIRDRDPRLGLADLLYGVTVGDTARGYPFEALARVEAPPQERVGGTDVVVFFDPDARSAAAYVARADARSLRFERVGSGRFRDVETGSQWDLEGRCLDGPLAGHRLERVEGLQTEWYGWYANRPETTLWSP